MRKKGRLNQVVYVPAGSEVGGLASQTVTLCCGWQLPPNFKDANKEHTHLAPGHGVQMSGREREGGRESVRETLAELESTGKHGAETCKAVTLSSHSKTSTPAIFERCLRTGASITGVQSV